MIDKFYQTVKTIFQILMVVIFSILTQSCDEKSEDPEPENENEIEIVYSIELSGTNSAKVYGTVEYSNGNGTETIEFDGSWETKVSVPRGHNLFYRVDGTLEQGNLVVKATATDTANGNVVFSDQASESFVLGTKGDFDFTIQSKGLGN